MTPWSPQQREWLAALGHVVHVAAPPPGLVDDPLRLAMLRAAGREATASDARALLRAWPPSASLRGDAAAKRHLWPQLRALRRGMAG